MKLHNQYLQILKNSGLTSLDFARGTSNPKATYARINKWCVALPQQFDQLEDDLNRLGYKLQIVRIENANSSS
jgi:hypothetical protein